MEREDLISFKTSEKQKFCANKVEAVKSSMQQFSKLFIFLRIFLRENGSKDSKKIPARFKKKTFCDPMSHFLSFTFKAFFYVPISLI